MTTVGVIGLGKMGLPIAQNLMDRGFTVVGYRRSGTGELAALGGTGARSAAEVASASDVLLSILPDVAALREVLLGPHGTMTKLRPGMVHVEMSTLDVAEKAARRDLRAVGLHGCLRHRGAPEVRRQPPGRGAHRRDRGGDAAGPPQRPGPRAGPAHPRRLDRLVGDLAAPWPARP